MTSKSTVFSPASTIYEFGAYRLDGQNLTLFRDGKLVQMPPKTCEVLLALVKNANRVVTKQEILETVWADTFVEEANLPHHISALRKALGGGAAGEFIETAPRRGYRFVAPVSAVSAPDFLEITTNERAVVHVIEEIEISRAPDSGEAVERHVERQIAAAPPRSKSHLRKWWSLGFVGLLTVLVFGSYWFFLRKPPIVFEPGNAKRLTTSGRAIAPKISPDGRFVLYLQRDGGERSIWIRQIATSTDLRITPPTQSEDVYGGLAFSRDGEHVYYSVRRKGENFSALYQVPSLGGTPRKILENLTGAVSFAPDGKRFAFLRSYRERNESVVLTANADGGDEQTVAVRKRPNHFNGSLSWSPDGATILCAAASSENGFHYEFIAVRAASGEMTAIRSRNWQSADSIAWLPDGDGFLFIGQSETSAVNQIWQVSYPSGESRQITADANQYGSLGLTADGRFLTANKLDTEIHLWLTNADGAAEAKELTKGANNYDGLGGLGVMSDKRIVYHSKASGADTIWMWDEAGNSRRLAEGGEPAISPDNRFVAFQGAGGKGIWRVDIEDGSLRRLTDGVDFTPAFSPDGRWIYFSRLENQTNVWRVSSEGGAAQLVTDEFRTTSSPAVSPDGKTLAVAYGKFIKKPDAPSGIALINLETNGVVQNFDVPELKFGSQYEQPTVRWTPDGAAINFIILRDGVSNVWQQPTAGGERIPVTNFKDGRIFNFAFAPDGRFLALARGKISSDVVLIEARK